MTFVFSVFGTYSTLSQQKRLFVKKIGLKMTFYNIDTTNSFIVFNHSYRLNEHPIDHKLIKSP